MVGFLDKWVRTGAEVTHLTLRLRSEDEAWKSYLDRRTPEQGRQSDGLTNKASWKWLSALSFHLLRELGNISNLESFHVHAYKKKKY